jgi:MYXO-CTERM domain-containing protein
MTEPTMRGLLQRVGVTALLTLLPALASAQTTGGTTTTTPTSGQTVKTATFDTGLTVKKGNETLKNSEVHYLSSNDCSVNANYSFSVTYTTAPPVVEAWLSNGGVDCTTSGRMAQVTSLKTGCTLLDTSTTGGTTRTFNLTGLQLLAYQPAADTTTTTTTTLDGGLDAGLDAGASEVSDAGVVTTNLPACEGVSGGQATVYILALGTKTSVENVPALYTAGGYPALKAGFAVYTELPAAPTSVTPLPGERSLGVGYKKTGSTTIVTEYEAYFDPEGCPSAKLTQGAPAPLTDTSVLSSGRTQGDKAYMDTSDVQAINLGKGVSAGVVTVDIAGNRSVLSEVTCVQREETTGFWDRCSNEPRCKEDFESCSTSRGAAGSAVGLSVLALALAALIRRRRSA